METDANENASNESDFSYPKLLERIKDYESRWTKIFQDASTNAAVPAEFEKLSLTYEGEYCKLTVGIMCAKSGIGEDKYLDLQHKLQNAKTTVDSYESKADAFSASRWEDKEIALEKKRLDTVKSFLDTFTAFIKKFGLGGASQ